MIYRGVPERFPDVKFVSVERGVGWLPFFPEVIDHQMAETTPNELAELSMLPSDYSRRQFYGCSRFERSTARPTLEYVGAQSLMFETDFPHPTCLYPRNDHDLAQALEGIPHNDVERIMSLNAAELYRINI